MDEAGQDVLGERVPPGEVHAGLRRGAPEYRHAAAALRGAELRRDAGPLESFCTQGGEGGGTCRLQEHFLQERFVQERFLLRY